MSNANEGKKEKPGFWMAVASFIVNKRKAIEILFLFAAIYCVFNMNRVKVNQDITSYLPATSETRIGLTTMEDQFVTYGSARVMVANITFDEALKLNDELSAIYGVKEVAFEKDKDHYSGSNALFDVTVRGGDDDEISIDAMNRVEDTLKDYDVYIATGVGAVEKSMSSLEKDMNMILVLAVLIIVVVLFISTKAFLEIPVLLITFGAAALLNKGTNFWFGEISSVTNSIAVVLQLALAIDYAIILCDRYMEEHETLPPVEACKVALSKAIPEISSSSLTTVSGMAAMMFMQFRLGFDMGIVLVKAIIFSLIAVFFLMPGVILIFAKGIDKTMHKSFVPKISFVGMFASLTKYVIPPIFVLVIIGAFLGSSNCEYLYDVDSVPSARLSESKIAKNKVEDVFGTTNQLVVMVPVGDYEKEAKLAAALEKKDYVISVTALSNQSVNDDYTVTDRLKPRQFAELTDLDIEIVRVLYMAYAYSIEQYGPVVTGIDDYKVPIIDMFLFLYDQYKEGYVTLSSDLDEKLTDLYDKLHEGVIQLKGTEYSRMVLNFDMPVEGEPTYEKMEEIRRVAEGYYGDGTVILVGNSTSASDLASSFATDNIIISVLTALFVLIILFFTFQSAGLPVLLVLTIQGSIWINFTVPSIEGQGVYFIAYLIVSAIQMGATIDYAIVISSRYLALKAEMDIKHAITETLNQAFPTIFTSGTILTCAGFLIGEICSDATVAAIGVALGRGTLISIILVLFVLPQILLFGDFIIEKTALSVKIGGEQKNLLGRVALNGFVRGDFHGHIEGEVKGVLNGHLDAVIDTKLPGQFCDEEEYEMNQEKKEGPNIIGAAKKSLMLILGAFLLAGLGRVEARALEPDVAVTVDIESKETFLEFAKDCGTDTYSAGKIFNLTKSIDLTGEDFEGIPFFSGTFNGNGYTISGVKIKAEGTDIGFFRYIGEGASVLDLNVSGSVEAKGSGLHVGGLAGCNRGIISDCSFDGSVNGDESVGGICGINEETGVVAKSLNKACVIAKNNTGGIVGENLGSILECTNKGEVNTDELTTSMNFGGVELGTLNVSQNLSTRNNSGGIAGFSSGLICSSTNEGTIGYDHIGYNVGGIAGAQSGKLFKSVNKGLIKGRKDVGGIVGQAMPYIEEEKLNDKAEDTRNQVDALSNTISSINKTVKNTSSQAREDAKTITENAKDKANVNIDIKDVSKDSVKEDVENLKNKEIKKDDFKDINLSKDDITKENIESEADKLSDRARSYEDVNQLIETLDNGVQSVSNGVTKAMNQIDGIRSSVRDGFSVITGDEAYIEDVSSLETALISDGVISECVNEGKVFGDINAGGIAGTMNVEYQSNPEFDIDFTEEMSLVLRSTVNDVIYKCKNYGRVNTKKNYVGGIVGLESIGLIYGSENYGNIETESGSYAGGIAGQSDSSIENCYMLSNVTATSYVGGITGNGYSVKDSVAVPKLYYDGEAKGAIAGWIRDGSDVANNVFVGKEKRAIDNIDYEGVASELSYEELMELEGIPDDFKNVRITFECEDEELEIRVIGYGSSIKEDSFPSIEEREGYYVLWTSEGAYSNIKENLRITAEYIPWTESVGSKEKTEGGKNIFLAVGEFTEDTEMTLTERSFTVSQAKSTLLYAYSFDLSKAGNGNYAHEVEGHFYCGKEEKKSHAVLMIETDGKWKEVEAERDGSYLVATIPVGSSFAVLTYQDKSFFEKFKK